MHEIQLQLTRTVRRIASDFLLINSSHQYNPALWFHSRLHTHSLPSLVGTWETCVQIWEIIQGQPITQAIMFLVRRLCSSRFRAIHQSPLASLQPFKNKDFASHVIPGCFICTTLFWVNHIQSWYHRDWLFNDIMSVDNPRCNNVRCCNNFAIYTHRKIIKCIDLSSQPSQINCTTPMNTI